MAQEALAPETGAYGQLWATALTGDSQENPFFHATGHSMRMIIPRHGLPETELEWKVTSPGAAES